MILFDSVYPSAARGSNLPGVTTARILEQLVAGYEKALSDDIELGMDKSDRSFRENTGSP